MNQYTSPNTCTCNPPAPREIKKKTMAPEFRLHGRNGEGWTYPGHKYGPGYLQACGCADCGVAVNLAQTLQPKYNTSEAREKFRMHWSIYKTEFGHGRSPLSEVITADGEAICYERRDELKCNGGKMNYPEARRSSFILLKKRPAHPFVDVSLQSFHALTYVNPYRGRRITSLKGAKSISLLILRISARNAFSVGKMWEACRLSSLNITTLTAIIRGNTRVSPVALTVRMTYRP